MAVLVSKVSKQIQAATIQESVGWQLYMPAGKYFLYEEVADSIDKVRLFIDRACHICRFFSCQSAKCGIFKGQLPECFRQNINMTGGQLLSILHWHLMKI